MEKLGIPTVTVATSAFIDLARSTMSGYGAPDMAFVVVPHPMGGIKLEEIQAKADAAFDDIVAAATQWQPSSLEAPPAKPPYPAETFTLTGTLDDVIAFYYKNGWTDGLPIVPPTPERVAEMLSGTSHKPDEVIGLVPPRMGVLTVELVAVHAVMAGAKPQYMPVLLAAMEALLDPAHEFRAATTTTNPCAPILVVNGPVRDDLGIQYGTGALAPSPYSEPNATIGRALNLIADVIGGSKAPSPDKSTLGFPGSYTMVLGENEEANPWHVPLNVQMGWPAGSNTVGVFEVRSFVNFNLHNPNTAEGLLHPMARTIGLVAGLAENGIECGEDARKLLVLSPEHAATIHGDGWTLDQVKQYLFENSYVSMSDYLIRNNGKAPRCRADQDPLTVTSRPEDFLVIVAGGEGKHSVYLETTRYVPVVKSIDAWR